MSHVKFTENLWSYRVVRMFNCQICIPRFLVEFSCSVQNQSVWLSCICCSAASHFPADERKNCKNIIFQAWTTLLTLTLRSRCATLWLWRCWTPSKICLMKKDASSSVNLSLSAIKSNNSPPLRLKNICICN